MPGQIDRLLERLAILLSKADQEGSCNLTPDEAEYTRKFFVEFRIWWVEVINLAVPARSHVHKRDTVMLIDMLIQNLRMQIESFEVFLDEGTSEQDRIDSIFIILRSSRDLYEGLLAEMGIKETAELFANKYDIVQE